MPDANLRVPTEARDRLAQVAQSEGLSLRAYLTRLASQVTTPSERAVLAQRASAVLRAWSGYDPSPAEAASQDDELDRRLAAIPSLAVQAPSEATASTEVTR
jgi:hypothetical protein